MRCNTVLTAEVEALRQQLAKYENQKPVAYLTWHQGMRAPDDGEEFLRVAEPGDKSDDGTDAFPVYLGPI